MVSSGAGLQARGFRFRVWGLRSVKDGVIGHMEVHKGLRSVKDVVIGQMEVHKDMWGLL